jgi:hypothetical protein
VDREALSTYAQVARAQLPPDVMSELEGLWLGGRMGTERLDRAWDALRSWYEDRGWKAEDREVNAPGSSVRACRISKEAERHEATASSMMGIQQIMVFTE